MFGFGKQKNQPLDENVRQRLKELGLPVDGNLPSVGTFRFLLRNAITDKFKSESIINSMWIAQYNQYTINITVAVPMGTDGVSKIDSHSLMKAYSDSKNKPLFYSIKEIIVYIAICARTVLLNNNFDISYKCSPWIVVQFGCKKEDQTIQNVGMGIILDINKRKVSYYTKELLVRDFANHNNYFEGLGGFIHFSDREE